MPNKLPPKPAGTRWVDRLPPWVRDFLSIYAFAFSQAVPIPALGLLILLLILGWVGKGIGGFAVIWKDPPDGHFYDSALFWNGFGLSLFYLVLCYLIYLLYANDRPEKKAAARRFALVSYLAFPMLVAVNLPVLVPVLFDPYEEVSRGQLFANRQLYLYGSISAAIVFLVLIRMLTHAANRALKNVESAADRPRRRDALTILLEAVVDIRLRGKTPIERQADGLFGFVLAVFAGLVGYTLREGENSVPFYVWIWIPAALAIVSALSWRVIRWWSLRRFHAIGPADDPARREHLVYTFASYFAASMFWIALLGILGYGFAWATEKESATPVIPAPLSFSFLLGSIAVVYGVLRFYAGRGYYPILIAGVAVMMLIAARRPYPHQIDELAPYYANKVDLAKYDELRDDKEANAKQLDNAAVLEAWQKGVNEYRGKPKTNRPPLVIVTTAGGASVSAVYTFQVLAELEKQIPGFHRHVRIITGASGGMFGASAYRAWLGSGGSEETLGSWKKGLEQDFFSPAVQAFAFKDIPMALGCYRGYSNDRGRRLERVWEKELPKPWRIDFEQMRKEELGGTLPSLIFSPMLVEDGRPLLISTLNLKRLSEGRYYVSNLPPKELKPGEVAEPTPADPTPAVEFFKLFPNENGWSLRLGTAARLSASFPYLSPASTLPTLPPRRIVDAGYLDNYGIGVALGWLNDYIDDIDLATERVIILEIRPYGSTDDPKSVKTKEENRANGKAPRFVSPLTEWTTPLEGGETARRAGMVGRNNLNRDLFVDLQDESRLLTEEIQRVWRIARKGQKDEPLPFTIIPIRIKGNLDASLNWTLPKKELDDIHLAADEVFMSEADFIDKHCLTEATKRDSEYYLRWKHNALQFAELRREFKNYLPKK